MPHHCEEDFGEGLVAFVSQVMCQKEGLNLVVKGKPGWRSGEVLCLEELWVPEKGLWDLLL